MAGMPPELVLAGECTAGSLKPASYVFREPSGNLWCRVTQLTPRGILGFTKFRTVGKLDLALELTSGGRYTLRRERGWWKTSYQLLDQGLEPVWSFSVLGTSWTVTEARTGAVAMGKKSNPFVLGPQRAALATVDGSVLAAMAWHAYSFRLGTFAQVQLEVFRKGWELPAVAFAVVLWLGLQKR
jgi:hypothetical protein